MIMITPLPGVTATKPGSATFPFPGIAVDVVDGDGNSVPLGGGGYLVLKRPWPAMLRGIYGDPERYKQTYWSRFPGNVLRGRRRQARRRRLPLAARAGGRRDERLRAPHQHDRGGVGARRRPAVAEAAVVGKNDPITGQAIFAFVIPKVGVEANDAFAAELRDHVAKVIGPLAKPKFLMFTPDLPKTRSGKIMRRLLRDIAEGRTLGDTTTLADNAVVETIRSNTGSAEE